MGLKNAIRRYVGDDEELASLRIRLEEAEARASHAERRALSYFSLLERLEKQRNDWKDMWFAQLGEHQAAQSILENALVSSRQLLARAVFEINTHRKEKNIPAVTGPKDLSAPPVGTAANYEKRMKALEAAAPVDLDVKAEIGSVSG